jgi:hypothetical protein
MGKSIRYMIKAGEGAYPKRRRILAQEFETRSEAQAYLNKLLTPGKINNFGVRQTSYRNAMSGTGIHNPRIIKREVYR